MPNRPILLGIVGDSAAGKTTLTRGIAQILGAHDVTTICTDDYHRYDRKQRAELGITALHPDCNYLDIMQQHLAMLRTGQPILKPVYSHTTGTFEAPVYIKPSKYAIVEGLLGYASRGARDCYDMRVYLAPPESLRYRWKIKRDTQKRGYTEEQVLDELRKREPDSEQFIRPQRRWADLVVSFYPPEGVANEETTNLNVRLVLRPTVPHPDFTRILERTSHEDHPAIRLELDRDMGKPVDVLEIDSHATAEQVKHLEEILCEELPNLRPFCSVDNRDLGVVTGTTGEMLRSYPLAITQLLVAFHMLKAMQMRAESAALPL